MSVPSAWRQSEWHQKPTLLCVRAVLGEGRRPHSYYERAFPGGLFTRDPPAEQYEI